MHHSPSFTVYTDNKPLTHVLSLTRHMADFHLDIKYSLTKLSKLMMCYKTGVLFGGNDLRSKYYRCVILAIKKSSLFWGIFVVVLGLIVKTFFFSEH